MKKMMSGMGFAGMMASTPSKSSQSCHYNHYTGHANDGRTVQMTQAPNRRGNGRMGDVMNPAPSSAHGREQKRGKSMAMPTCGCESRNVGRGPTKGNKR